MRHPIRLLTLLAAVLLALPAAALADVTHTVRRGETLTSIAAADGLSVARLAAANGLSTTAPLVARTNLVIPPQAGPVLPAGSAPSGGESSGAASDGDADADDRAGTAGASTPSAASAASGYVVQAGDTLSGIAAHLGTTAAALASANGMSVDGLLLAGRTLVVPAGAGATTTQTATATSVQTASGTGGSGAQPVAQYVAPSEVGSIAAGEGVPAALAEAIAYQESGFNDALVSASGATGVMQLEPSTWSDLSRVYGLDLSPSSAVDNVRGGVAVLHSLLLATGGNQDEAIAAYYQGLDSVRTRGILPGTRHYVDDVLALESRFGG